MADTDTIQSVEIVLANSIRHQYYQRNTFRNTFWSQRTTHGIWNKGQCIFNHTVNCGSLRWKGIKQNNKDSCLQIYNESISQMYWSYNYPINSVWDRKASFVAENNPKWPHVLSANCFLLFIAEFSRESLLEASGGMELPLSKEEMAPSASTATSTQNTQPGKFSHHFWN